MNQCYSSLIACVRLYPDEVALQLRQLPLGSGMVLPPGLIGNYQKAQFIVDHMKNYVMGNPQIFDLFLKVLEGAGSWTGTTVSELKRTRLSLQHPGKLAPKGKGGLCCNGYIPNNHGIAATMYTFCIFFMYEFE